MSDRPFVHLHCHSHYSLLDGASPIKKLVQRAGDLGMNALAVTDHGNLHGALEFYNKAKDAGLNPIIGYEAYVAPGTRKRKEADAHEESSYHLTLLAQNRTGFQNLVKMSSAAYLEGFYYKPRIDRELLEAHHEGIVCLSGCVSGEFSRAILRGADPLENLDDAIHIAQWFHGIFGDRYYIEIQDNGLDIQRQAKIGAVEVAQRLGLPLVATSDAHYVDREDAVAQDILLCINTGRFRADPKRMKMEGDEFYLRSPEDMYDAFPGHEDAVRRSQEIADGIDIDLELKRHFPVYTPPQEKTSADYLRELCVTGLTERYAGNDEMLPEGKLAPVAVERLDRELGVINKLGYANYFLIVWDFVREAVARDIPASARGSGVGSLVAFALRLSHVCPLKYDLLFERFLDESRKEPPDIDIDFCKERRGEIIDYVKQKYGSENVAQIGTFGTLQARAAIRDVGRALGLPIARVDAVVALVPDKLGISLDEALEEGADLKKVYDEDAEVRELLDLSRKIEGLARNVGTHAAAVVIADRPLDEYVPLCRVTGKEDVITQWSMNDVEAAGLLKMDFLGLRNLTILSKAVALIEQTRGVKIDTWTLPLDDQPTFDLLCRGETKGIFQLESGGIRDLLRRMKPDSFLDIIATNALYRPGPLEGGMVDQYIDVKHGRKPAEYPHPTMKDVLQETHGVMVYQEQVMRILNHLGDIPLPSAYTCIKAISKKKLPIIARFSEEFYTGATAKGLSQQEAEGLFEMIKKFAGYGFNKSHSTAYAQIAYTTAYLKAHYPVEFMAALLSGDIPGRNFKRKDSLIEHKEDCERMEIDVLPPDVNASHGEFTVEEGKIRFGLCAIKGCGGPAAAAIVSAREADGPFAGLFDFCERIDVASCNRATIETLIKAGAFDSLGARRAQLMAALERGLQGGAAKAADRRSGQMNMFDDLADEDLTTADELPDVPEWDDDEFRAGEKENLGFYLSSHPLAAHEETIRTFCSHTSAAAAALASGAEVMIGGSIASIKFSNTRKARPGSTSTKYAMFDLEDFDGLIRCIIWPDDFARHEPLVQADALIAARGAVDKRPGSDEANVIVRELVPLEQVQQRCTRGVRIMLDEARHDVTMVKQLHEILRYYPGPCELELALILIDGNRVHMKSDTFRIRIAPEMRRRVEELLGPGHFQPLVTAMARGNGRGNGNGRSRRTPS